MNDATRASIFRNPEAETPEKWALLKDAVDNVRSDLIATNSDKIGHQGKWAVRYPNGDRPANEADCTFMAKARGIVLALMAKVEAQSKSIADAAGVIASMTETNAAEIAARDTLIGELRAEIETLKTPAPVKPEAEEAEAPSHLTEAPKANMDEAKPKRKRMTKAEAATILDITPAPDTAESTAPAEA